MGVAKAKDSVKGRNAFRAVFLYMRYELFRSVHLLEKVVMEFSPDIC